MELTINNNVNNTTFNARLSNSTKRGIRKGIVSKIARETELKSIKYDLDTYVSKFEEIKKYLAATGKKGTYYIMDGNYITGEKYLVFEGPGTYELYKIPKDIQNSIKLTKGKIEEIPPEALYRFENFLKHTKQF
ncbi:hypothetical protein J6S88_01540 [bacterium]|nr:hypothetical protein [bacterium]